MIKNLLTKFLVSRIGSIATPIVAGIIAALVARVSAFDPTLAEKLNTEAVVGFIIAALVSAANYFTNDKLTTDVKKIQAVVNVPRDGWFGPVTYTEVRKAIPVVK
jgi:F0F1-type ATP synthase membrane subunit c/vacuolar-type H+-ATPase subunit K